MIEEQIHGGVAQGIGWALYEGIVLDEDGRVMTGSLLDYALPDRGEDPADRDGAAGGARPGPGRSACAASASRR